MRDWIVRVPATTTEVYSVRAETAEEAAEQVRLSVKAGGGRGVEFMHLDETYPETDPADYEVREA